MEKRSFYWRETLRTWSQWAGVAGASIAAGLLLGILLRAGVAERQAQSISLAVGFVSALLLWAMIGHWLAARPVEMTTGFSASVIQFEFAPEASHAAPAFAAAVLCISVQMPAQPTPLHCVTPLSPVNINAVSQI
jgi:hypothetical protein